MSFPLPETHHTCGLRAPPRPTLHSRRLYKKQYHEHHPNHPNPTLKPLNLKISNLSNTQNITSEPSHHHLCTSKYHKSEIYKLNSHERSTSNTTKEHCRGCLYMQTMRSNTRLFEWLDVDSLLTSQTNNSDPNFKDNSLQDHDDEKLALGKNMGWYRFDHHEFIFEPHSPKMRCKCYWCTSYFKGYLGLEEHDENRWCFCGSCERIRGWREEKMEIVRLERMKVEGEVWELLGVPFKKVDSEVCVDEVGSDIQLEKKQKETTVVEASFFREVALALRSPNWQGFEEDSDDDE